MNSHKCLSIIVTCFSLILASNWAAIPKALENALPNPVGEAISNSPRSPLSTADVPAQPVTAESASAVIRQIQLPTNDIIYDPVGQMIYASVPSRAGNSGNSIIQINPVTLTAGTPVFMGSEPGILAISDNGQYLYVSLDGSAAIRRFDIATQTAGLQFWPGNKITSGAVIPNIEGPYSVKAMKVLPGQPESIAITRQFACCSGSYGVAVYRNGVQLPNTTSDIDISQTNKLAFSSSASTLYAVGDYGDFLKMAVDANGVSTVQTIPYYKLANPLYVDIKFDNGLIYSPNGQIFDPEAAKFIGTFPGGNFVIPDSKAGRIYTLKGTLINNGLGNYQWTINAYDLHTSALIGSVDVPNVSGDPSSFTRWGANGFAFRTSTDQVFILRTSLVPSSEPPDMHAPAILPAPTPTPPPATIRELSLPNNDLIYDRQRGVIYASVPGYAGAKGNTITSIDPATGAIGPSIPVGPDPGTLAISRDGQYLYAALNGSESVRRVDLASRTPGLQIPLGTTYDASHIPVSKLKQIRSDIRSVPCDNNKRLTAVRTLFKKMGARSSNLSIQKFGSVENLIVRKQPTRL